jgi:hypothetical protein
MGRRFHFSMLIRYAVPLRIDAEQDGELSLRALSLREAGPVSHTPRPSSG